LIPTRIYVPIILELIQTFHVKGIAHITGGGLYSNVKRVIPEGLDIRIDWKTISSQPIFDIIQQAGEVDVEEMRATFNMGIGMVLMVNTDEAEMVLSNLKERGESARIIGEVYV
jgi:phosphoribosylformylglycinamidine cyclo-ligase